MISSMSGRTERAGSGAFNGDLGIIEAVDPRAGSLRVRADDRLITYTGENIRELEIAYAITIHKSQGSEFGAVVLPVTEDTPRRLCYRNLIYTGVTRAKRLLVLVGSRAVLHSMIENDRKDAALFLSCAAFAGRQHLLSPIRAGKKKMKKVLSLIRALLFQTLHLLRRGDWLCAALPL